MSDQQPWGGPPRPEQPATSGPTPPPSGSDAPPPPYPGTPAYPAPPQASPYGQGGYAPGGYPQAPSAPAYAGGYAGGGYGGYGGAPAGELAHWGLRVGAYLIDSIVAGLVPFVLYMVAVATSETQYDALGQPTFVPTGTGTVLMLVAGLLQLATWIWNRVLRQGRTGQSIGKQVMKTRLVREDTGQAPGAGVAFGRDIAHILDGFLYLGYLWPLWDPKKQTFADKIVRTLVVR